MAAASLVVNISFVYGMQYVVTLLLKLIIIGREISSERLR